MLAALTSAAMPGISIAGVREGEQANATDEVKGISQAVVQDATGRLFDVFATSQEDGRKRLAGRVRAARALAQAREPGGLGFALDQVAAATDGDEEHCATGDTSVMVAVHHDGQARSLSLLTLEDCASVGTAIGAIHRLRPRFLQEAGYPVFSTGQIRAQLTAWIKRLRQAGHVPSEITSNWSDIMETDGLWSFATCPVHGGFADGDFLFSGSAITAVTNWQNMQVNDPARDLAWIFSSLDDAHRNAVLSAYGRMLGSRLDDLIMLRANLWLQMEEVGEFIQALNRADNAKIMQFKAHVERLAHQLSLATKRKSSASSRAADANGKTSGNPPSTITVGTLLQDSDRRKAAAQAAQQERAQDVSDETGESDRTGSAQIRVASQDDSTVDRPVQSGTATVASPAPSAAEKTGNPSDVTMAISDIEASASSHDRDILDDTNESGIEHSSRTFEDNTATIAIPLLEREERAMRDAKAGLETEGMVSPNNEQQEDETVNDATNDNERLDPDDTGESTPKA